MRKQSRLWKHWHRHGPLPALTTPSGVHRPPISRTLPRNQRRHRRLQLRHHQQHPLQRQQPSRPSSTNQLRCQRHRHHWASPRPRPPTARTLACGWPDRREPRPRPPPWTWKTGGSPRSDSGTRERRLRGGRTTCPRAGGDMPMPARLSQPLPRPGGVTPMSPDLGQLRRLPALPELLTPLPLPVLLALALVPSRPLAPCLPADLRPQPGSGETSRRARPVCGCE